MIRMITRVMMVVRDTTSITAMATESSTVGSLLAGAPEPEDIQLTNITSSTNTFTYGCHASTVRHAKNVNSPLFHIFGYISLTVWCMTIMKVLYENMFLTL